MNRCNDIALTTNTRNEKYETASISNNSERKNMKH